MTAPTSNSVVEAAAPPAIRTNDAGARSLGWWKRLADPERGDPATLARLRRARTTLEAASIRPAMSLARLLGGAKSDAPDWRTRAALDLARVLAHVREHDAVQHPMRAVGWRRFAGDRKETAAGEDRPRLAEARFRRFMQVGDGDEKVEQFTRLVRFLNGQVKVDDLARDFLRWNDPVNGDRVRERWAYFYYAAQDATPLPQDDTELPAEENER